ncbi:hypothetical protein GCM10007907_20540 [Chitinimonas prasina]|uniref:Phage tail protein I n=1 Tax=Chitinimonas prasina TaxID=1434937 RepID=A0ABQ5YH39_9NEIS|nr:phage tail protein I [Chitinimonas prasina]GLR13264.1 hypothetical protein GCM10007907_20540 [Chitinimonas prasina]
MSARLLPPNSTPLERALANVLPSGLDPEGLRKLWNADACPAAFLPFLAWAMSVDGWDAATTEAQQRALIRGSAALHRRKGTVWAIRHVFELLDIDATLAEWPAYQGEPYTFRVRIEVTDRGIDPARLAALHRLIAEYKSARSHLDRLDVELVTRAPMNTAGHAAIRPTCIAYPQVLPINSMAPTHTGAAAFTRPQICVLPKET